MNAVIKAWREARSAGLLAEQAVDELANVLHHAALVETTPPPSAARAVSLLEAERAAERVNWSLGATKLCYQNVQQTTDTDEARLKLIQHAVRAVVQAIAACEVATGEARGACARAREVFTRAA